MAKYGVIRNEDGRCCCEDPECLGDCEGLEAQSFEDVDGDIWWICRRCEDENHMADMRKKD